MGTRPRVISKSGKEQRFRNDKPQACGLPELCFALGRGTSRSQASERD